MKRFTVSAIYIFFGLFLSQGALASIYRITFNYGADTGGSAGLTGFMEINTSLDTGNERSNDNIVIDPFPNWITTLSLTYDPTPLNPGSGDEVTKDQTTMDYIRWDLKAGQTFDINSDFVPQFDSFGFQSVALDGSFSIGANSMNQNYVANNAGSEFPLNSTATTPGGLPLLGIGTLIYYYKKLKTNKS